MRKKPDDTSNSWLPNHALELDGTRKKTVPRTKHNFTTTLQDGTVASPLAQQATCGERGDIGGASQLLVFGIELESVRHSFANGLGQADQHSGESLTRGMANQSHMGGDVPCQIVVGD